MNLNKIMIIMMCCLLMVGNSLAYTTEDLRPEVTIRDVNVFADFFINTFAITSSGVSNIQREAGERFDVDFRYNCQGDASSQFFTVSFENPRTGELFSGGNYNYGFEVYDGCDENTGWTYAEISNVKVPNFDDSFCGNLIKVKVKHERFDNGRYVVDSYNGQDYMRVDKIQLDCEDSACEGLTGEWAGDAFCRSYDGMFGGTFYQVKRKKYTDIVRDGECVTNEQVLDTCRDDCRNGECVFKEGGYVVSKDCSYAEYEEGEEPDDFYKDIIECNAVKEMEEELEEDEGIETKLGYTVDGETCREVEYIVGKGDNVQFKDKSKCKEFIDEQLNVCTTEWDPVCGKDGQTYSNKCKANKAGVGVKYAGECLNNIDYDYYIDELACIKETETKKDSRTYYDTLEECQDNIDLGDDEDEDKEDNKEDKEDDEGEKTPKEQEENVFQKIWNWILNLFKSNEK